MTIFVLPLIGLVVLYGGEDVLIFWILFAYMLAYPLIYALFVPVLTGNGKLSLKKLLLLSFSITIISVVFTNLAWAIATPKWSFSLVTDKSTYRLGEAVKITVSIRNLGFIAHSFESSVSDPVVVSIEYQYTENPTTRTQVWYSPFHISTTRFSIAPNESLERNFTWNQTNVHIQREEIKLGRYYITALVPRADSTNIGLDNLFITSTKINITA